MDQDIKLGDLAMDTITGFTGIVIGKAEYLSGEVTFGIQPPIDKDGKIPEDHWFNKNKLIYKGKPNLPGALIGQEMEPIIDGATAS